jgi:hypothetical protein
MGWIELGACYSLLSVFPWALDRIERQARFLVVAPGIALCLATPGLVEGVGEGRIRCAGRGSAALRSRLGPSREPHYSPPLPPPPGHRPRGRWMYHGMAERLQGR